MKKKCLFILLFSSNLFAIEKVNCNDKFYTVTLEECEKLNNSIEQYNLGIKYRERGDFEQSFYWINTAAESQLKEAKFNLAWFYETGSGVEQDQKLAFKYMKDLVDQGYLPALNNLGKYYQNGIGVERNLKKAVELYQQAIDKGLPSIPYINLSYAYFYGLGVEKDREKAINLIQPLANAEYALAMSNLGAFYKELGNIEQSLFWIEKAARKGNGLAQTNLGFAYAKGVGHEKNKDNALYWLNKALEKNEPQAYFIMGTLYSDKNSILEFNLEKAFEYYYKGAVLGNGNARNNLANWLFNGKFIPKNEREGLKWYLKSATENNIIPSMYALYQIYSRGTKEIPQDLDKAKYWLEKARKNGLNQ